MKKIIIALVVTLFISVSSFAQQGINFKALVKDDLGNVLTDQTIGVQFQIREASANGSAVYTETHTSTTDANGIIVLNIGTGSTSDTFGAIDWSSNVHWLNLQIDITGGTNYTDMSTTQFMAVPYALSAGNITGLESINEGNGLGWRLKGFDSSSYGSIGLGAVDLSYSEINSNYGATAANAFATGVHTIASGQNSTAMGVSTRANSYAEIVLGSYNPVNVPNSTTSWNQSDKLFSIGNGYKSGGLTIYSNALTIFKNGSILAPSFSIAEIDNADGKALITKEYADLNLGGTGLEKLSEGIDSGTGLPVSGWRLKGTDPLNYGNIGESAVDLSYSLSPSSQSGATDNYSVALGLSTISSNFASTAMGNATIASGYASTSMGNETIASNTGALAIGNYNIDIPTAVFMIGNGYYNFFNGEETRLNALTVLQNGKTGINTSDPKSLFEVAHQNIGLTPSNLTNAFSIKNSNSDKSWQFHVNNLGALVLYRNGIYTSYFHETSGAYVTISDRRLKKDITSLENGTLNKVMQLNPVSYLMKDQTDTKRNLGLISQEVQEIFPSITNYVEEADLITLSYTELIPILIKALQEQQGIIEAQHSENIQQNHAIESLLQRMNALEVANN